MTIASMTGFARTGGTLPGFGWAWEAKSVNARGLDLRFRLPGGYEHLEADLRSLAAARLKRGSLSVNLAVTDESAQPRLVVNETALAQILDLAAALSARLAVDPPRIDGLLNLRGVLESAPVAIDPAIAARRGEVLLAGFADLIADLAAMRAIEGRHLAAAILAQIAEIEALVAAARASEAAQLPAIRDRLQRQLAELLPGEIALDPARLAQEAALLATRADIREELDRLAGHIAALRSLFAEGGAIGRKLDFLCQELNREANTLCAKAADSDLTGIGIALKAAIEQMREQIQNIE